MSPRDEIIRELDRSGYANGSPFANEAEVRAYFQRARFVEMFPGDEIPSQSLLDACADVVIRERRHME